MTIDGPVIEARGLAGGHGSVPVLREIDLHVGPGQVVALLGANGAGKTTLMLALAGELPPTAGEVRWRGAPTMSPLHVRSREGLAFITEERSVFMGLTVADNLRLGRGDRAEALELFPELEPLLDRRAGLLSGGEQQMLTLARALAARPALLLADEVSLGLAPMAVERLFRAIRRYADDGGAVLLVEQQPERALTVADRAYVMARGRIALGGDADEVRRRLHEVEDLYISGPTRA